MLSSAIASSSPVEIPARTLARSSSRVRPTTRPALRMPAICSGVLISIPRSRKPISRWSRFGDDVQRLEDPRRDLVDLSDPVDLVHDATLLVDLDQRRGLLEVELLAAPDHVLGVVRAALDLGPLEQPAHDLVLVDG